MQRIFCGTCIIALLFLAAPCAHAQPDQGVDTTVANRSTTEIVRLAWEASNKDNLADISALVEEILRDYGNQAKILAAQLDQFPPRDRFNEYKVMSDVATTLFIKAETLMRQGKNKEAIKEFKGIIAQYPWAQNFDPSRGSYWSVADKSQSSIDMMEGKDPSAQLAASNIPKTLPQLKFQGTEDVIDWTKFGNFLNVGTKNYHYQITDQAGLAAGWERAYIPTYPMCIETLVTK